MRRQAPEVSSADLAQLCHRIRAAGAPGGKARPKLLTEYERYAATLGLRETPEIVTGRDLERAASLLLRKVSGRERADRSRPGSSR